MIWETEYTTFPGVTNAVCVDTMRVLEEFCYKIKYFFYYKILHKFNT